MIRSVNLAINKSHTGNFTRGQVGATYTVAVSNTGPDATSGQVTVTDALPGRTDRHRRLTAPAGTASSAH